MRQLWLDLETYSETPIRNGIYRYAEDAEIILWAWAIDDGEVDVWDLTAGDGMPDALRDALASDDTMVYSHESFDRVVLARAGYPVSIDRWWDTAAQARSHSLPGALEKLCHILGVPTSQSKMPGGKDLVRLFTVPKNGKRATAKTHPEKWQRFIDYCGLDVVAMREVWRRLPQWNYGERGQYGVRGRDLWKLDQRINDRGIAVDTRLAQEAVSAVARVRNAQDARVQELTWDSETGESAVERATQRDRLLEHLLAEWGITLPDLKASTLERRLEDENLPDVVKELLAIRLQAATASVGKYKALLRSVTDDGRLHGTIRFRGALRTGRRSGAIFQPQNLARLPKFFPGSKIKAKDEYDWVADAIREGVGDILLSDPIETMGYMVRGAIIAPAGRKLNVADLSNIEGRMMAWLAGEDWKLRAFEEFDAGLGHDLYVLSYASSFKVAPEVVIADSEAGGIMRQIGKVQELALQYWGAKNAFKKMAAIYGVFLEDERIEEIVRLWRKANQATMSFSGDLEKAARNAILFPGRRYSARSIRFQRDGEWLRMRLPSGRVLAYPRPQVDDEGVISYLGVNHYTHQWERITTYGGKLGENAVQAASGDIMFENEPEIERAGYEIVFDNHDEVVSETPDSDQFSGEALAKLLATSRPWSHGLPLVAAGFSTARYRKG